MPESKYFETKWAKEEISLTKKGDFFPITFLTKEELEDLGELIFRTKIEFFSEA